MFGLSGKYVNKFPANCCYYRVIVVEASWNREWVYKSEAPLTVCAPGKARGGEWVLPITYEQEEAKLCTVLVWTGTEKC